MKNRKRTLVFVILIASLLILGLAACGGGGDAASDEQVDTVAEGKTIYDTLCIACHGPDGTGVEGLGKDLTTSEFVKSNTDSEMVAFIIEGRPASHPDNTTGVDMPPRGGNSELTDDDIANIVAYVRSLEK